MTRLESLEQCLDAVLSGTEERIIHHGAFCLDDAVNVDLAYAGSLDAAKSLHNAVLPDYRARIDVGRRYRAWVISPALKKVDAYALNPACAWLIAILKALIAEEKK